MPETHFPLFKLMSILYIFVNNQQSIPGPQYLIMKYLFLLSVSHTIAIKLESFLSYLSHIAYKYLLKECM